MRIIGGTTCCENHRIPTLKTSGTKVQQDIPIDRSLRLESDIDRRNLMAIIGVLQVLTANEDVEALLPV